MITAEMMPESQPKKATEQIKTMLARGPTHRPNENKMSDGHRERASIAMKMF